jgi:MFS family permease
MGAWAKLWRELGAGLALVARDRALRVIFGFLAVTAVGEGVFAVMLIVFVSRILDGGAMEIGWMMSAQAVGGITGGLVGGWIKPDVSPARLIGLGAVAFGLLDLAIFNYPALYPGIAPAIALFVAVGVPGVIALSALLTTMQNLVEDRFRGRVLGAMSTVQALLGVVGSAAAGLAADHFGVVTILNIQGLAYVASGLLVLVLLGRALASRAQPAPRAAAVT